MKDWTKEVEQYKEIIKDMSEDDVYTYLWDEYRNNRISKKAHDWLVMWF